jgi:hypothetical protein
VPDTSIVDEEIERVDAVDVEFRLHLLGELGEGVRFRDVELQGCGAHPVAPSFRGNLFGYIGVDVIGEQDVHATLGQFDNGGAPNATASPSKYTDARTGPA